MATQFKSLLSLLIDKRLKRKSRIYKTEERERERLGLRLAVSKPKTVAVKQSNKVTFGRLLECSRSKSKLEVLCHMISST